MTKQTLQEKIKRLERDLDLANSEVCRAETRRVIEYLKTKIGEGVSRETSG